MIILIYTIISFLHIFQYSSIVKEMARMFKLNEQMVFIFIFMKHKQM